MAYAGAFDSFKNTPRHVFFYKENQNSNTFLEQIIQYGHRFQDEENSAQVSLFGDLGPAELPDPDIPISEPWSQLETLKAENDVVGFYLSGHPLDEYKLEMERFINKSITDFKDDLEKCKNQTISFAGIITSPADTNMMTKTGKPFGKFTVEDYSGSLEVMMFGEDFEKYKNILNRKDQYVRIQALADKPKWREDYELKITRIELLSDILERYTKRIDLNIKLHDISSQIVDDLKAKIEGNLGKTPVNFQIIGEHNEVLHLTLPRLKVNAKGFINAIQDSSDIDLRIVS